ASFSGNMRSRILQLIQAMLRLQLRELRHLLQNRLKRFDAGFEPLGKRLTLLWRRDDVGRNQDEQLVPRQRLSGASKEIAKQRDLAEERDSRLLL
ncbi:MAG: hypothetical protein ACRD2L_19180, partial [Terriglobia bacterium]